MNIEKHRAFIDSLEGEKGLPEKMHGWRFDTPLPDGWETFDMPRERLVEFIEYLTERLRHAESRQITDLKEKVKELVRDAMDATDRYWHKPRADDDREMEQFHVLCTPDKGGEVRP